MVTDGFRVLRTGSLAVEDDRYMGASLDGGSEPHPPTAGQVPHGAVAAPTANSDVWGGSTLWLGWLRAARVCCVGAAARSYRQRRPFQPRVHRVCRLTERSVASMISWVPSQSMSAAAAM